MDSYKNDFNTSAEQSIHNRISPYNLNENEKAQVWQSIDERNKSLDKEKTAFRENWQERFTTELQQLRADQDPTVPRQEYRPMGGQPRLTDFELRRAAANNVQKNYEVEQKKLHQLADKKIDQILDSARKDGRGPQGNEHQQERTLSQEFQRAHDNR